MATFSGIGEVAAVTAAVFWCVSTVIYGRLGQEISPLSMNLFKGLIALVIMLVTMLGFGMAFTAMPWSAFLLLALSGIAGIGIGDTLHFVALKEMGARLCLLLETLAPPLTVMIAWVFLSEGLSLPNLIGIALTMMGIVWVITERTQGRKGQVMTLKGLACGFGAALCQAGGATLTFKAFTMMEMGALWTAVIRMSAGLVALLALMPFLRRQFALERVRQTSQHFWKWLTLASFVGTFLCIWLQQTALKYTVNPGIAQTLLSAAPVMILPLAAWQGERVSFRAVLGAVVAFSGIGVLLIF